MDRRDPVVRQLVVGASGRRLVSTKVNPTDGRSGRPRFSAGRSLRFLRPATSPSLPQVIFEYRTGTVYFDTFDLLLLILTKKRKKKNPTTTTTIDMRRRKRDKLVVFYSRKEGQFLRLLLF